MKPHSDRIKLFNNTRIKPEHDNYIEFHIQIIEEPFIYKQIMIAKNHLTYTVKKNIKCFFQTRFNFFLTRWYGKSYGKTYFYNTFPYLGKVVYKVVAPLVCPSITNESFWL